MGTLGHRRPEGDTTKYLRAATMHKYGVTLFVGIGIPIGSDEEMALRIGEQRRLYTGLLDYRKVAHVPS